MHRIGTFRDRLEFQTKTQTSDGMGGHTVTWDKDFRCWGSIKPIRGIEKLVGGQTQADNTYWIEIRYRTGITAAHRIVEVGSTDNVYNIRGTPTDMDRRKQYLKMKVEKYV